MTQGSRWSLLLLVCLEVVALSWCPVGAADKTKVDAATKRVEQGAKQIGQGKADSGFKEMFAGIGHTIVEGAKFSGDTMGAFFKKTFGS